MKQYQDLTPPQKKIFEAIEKIFTNTIIGKKDFVVALGVLINKYKMRK